MTTLKLSATKYSKFSFPDTGKAHSPWQPQFSLCISTIVLSKVVHCTEIHKPDGTGLISLSKKHQALVFTMSLYTHVLCFHRYDSHKKLCFVQSHGWAGELYTFKQLNCINPDLSNPAVDNLTQWFTHVSNRVYSCTAVQLHLHCKQIIYFCVDYREGWKSKSRTVGRRAFLKDGHRRKSMNTTNSTVVFIPSTKGGLLVGKLREEEDRMAALTVFPPIFMEKITS